MSSPIIVFDLDGTLVETAPDLIAAVNHAISTVGLAAVDAASFRIHVGLGGRVMIERAHAAHGKAISADETTRLFDLFIAHYGASMPGASLPYPGVAAALDRFEEAGFRLAICTNKLEQSAKTLMRGLALDHRFAAICGADTFEFSKPDPRHLLETIRLAGGDPQRTVMIGDSETDILTAQRASIPVVAVDFGYTEKHVREFGPDKIISHFDELTVAMASRLIETAAAAHS